MTDMNWEEVYELWKIGSRHFPEELNEPVSAETVFVEYNNNTERYIYGYDWLSNKEADGRKQLIANHPLQFIFFADNTNKGTIRTAQMLVEAKNKEELAAIWIAANSFELSHNQRGNLDILADQMYWAANIFLRDRFPNWHHAMRRLVPRIMIPRSVRNNLNCEDANTVMGLIQMNTLMLKASYRILRYTSIKDEKQLDEISDWHRLSLD